jgi:hypothetical protein
VADENIRFVGSDGLALVIILRIHSTPSPNHWSLSLFHPTQKKKMRGARKTKADWRENQFVIV